MKLQVKDVGISFCKSKKQVDKPLHEFEFIRVAPGEISVDIDGIACYFIKGGKEIIIWPYPGSEEYWIQDQLFKWGTVCILHQRKTMNFHASSFSLEGKGVMVLGDTGAGKSSLNAAFSLEKGVFLNDDITAITFKKGLAKIIKLEDQISLQRDSMDQLGQSSKLNALSQRYKTSISPGGEVKDLIPLNYILALKIDQGSHTEIKELSKTEKFTLLRSNISSWEMLQGMPGLEEEYMSQLLRVSNNIPLFLVKRPEKIDVNLLKQEVDKLILNYG
jgi:hypothetical protein